MRSHDLAALRERCVALIEAHSRNPAVNPHWLARELFVSRRQLDRAFSGGAGVAEMLGRQRVRHVVILAARNPRVPMSEIAVHCGYGTYETFRAQCHRYLQRSPRDACRAHRLSLRAAESAAA